MASTSCGWAGGGGLINVAMEELATRLNVPLQSVSVTTQEEVSWPDRSLGCPRKGMNYAQVITPGSRLILEVDGRPYAYHAAGGKPYSYCATPAKIGSPLGGSREDI